GAGELRGARAVGLDDDRDARARRDLIALAHLADARDELLREGDALLELGVAPGRVGRGPGRVDEQLRGRELRLDATARGELAELRPELLGDERHERVQEAQHLVEARREHLARER